MEGLAEFLVGLASSGLTAMLLAWFIGRPALRTAWCASGRLFGFYVPELYSKFLGIMGWRSFYHPYLWVRIWYEGLGIGTKASAKWASLVEQMYHVYKPGHIFLGRLGALGIPLFMPVGISGSKGRHLCIVASVGSSKTTHLMTMLSLHNGSAFVIDADAQMYNAMSCHLGDGGNGILGKGNMVVVLDPSHLSHKGQSSSWNAFDEIDAAVARDGRDAAVDVAKTLAAALIKITETRNEWVYTEARSFLTALILYVWLYEPPKKRNLVRLRELLTVGLRGVADEKYNPFDVLLYEMTQKNDFDGIIAKGAAMMETSQGTDGRNAPRSAAIDQTSWLDLPQIAAICKHSDFHCEDLKKGKVSLFVVASITDIQTKLSGWVRCLTMMTMEAFQKANKVRPKTPCLFCIDEAPSLRIETLPTFAATFRKYGGRLVTITQNLERLSEAYPDSWGSFLGDAEATIWLANDHKGTLEYLSSILGTTTRTETVKPKRWRRWILKEKPHTQQVERPLIYPHQLREFLDNNIIVTRSGKRPMRLKPAPYYKELPVFHYEADRFYGEKPLRRSFRAAWMWAYSNVPIYTKQLGQYAVSKTRVSGSGPKVLKGSK